jgi:hypothetical protein
VSTTFERRRPLDSRAAALVRAHDRQANQRHELEQAQGRATLAPSRSGPMTMNDSVPRVGKKTRRTV